LEKFKIKEKTKTLKIVEIFLEENELKNLWKKAVKQVKKSVKINGFRPGKAPDELIEKNFKNEIKEELIKIASLEKLEQLLNETELKPVATPKLIDIKWKEDLPEKLVFEIEELPDFEPSSYKKISISSLKKEITDEGVMKTLEKMKENAYTLAESQKEKPEENDFIKYDLTVLMDGKPVKNMSGTNLIAEMNPTKILPQLWPEILNIKKGETKDISFTPDENFKPKELAGKKITFRMKVNSVLTKKYPEINDDFAKMYGAENLNELKERIKKQLEKELETEKKRHLKDQIIEHLLKKNSPEIPKSLLEEEKKAILQNLKQRYPGIDEEKIKEEVEKAAKQNLASSIIIGKIAQKENISVSDEEAKNLLTKKDDIQALQRVKNILLTEKVFDFIIKEAKIK